MGCDGELWAGTDNRSGCPGDTNFSVQHPHPALPHQSLFSPDRADQWPRVMVVSSFVWRYSTAHHCDGSTRPERDRKRKGPPSPRCAKCTFGWACCCLWWWGGIPRGFLSNVSAAGQRGDMVSGMACLGRIHQHPIDLSKLAKEPPLLPHICQVYFSKNSQIWKPTFDQPKMLYIQCVNTSPNVLTH